MSALPRTFATGRIRERKSKDRSPDPSGETAAAAVPRFTHRRYSPMSMLTTAAVLAADPNINSDGIVAWGVKNIIPIVLLFIGLAIIAGARKGQMSQNAMTVTNVLLGCAVIGGAALFYGLGDDIATFVFARG
jgi:hypothetical protein